jgi:hypothetical protein
MQFDAQATDQLHAVGFQLEGDSNIAILRSVTDARKAMIVAVGQSDHPDFFEPGGDRETPRSSHG